MSMDEFAGKVALITGAGHGFGREIALAFGSLGVLIAANDINPISLDETVNQIQKEGGKAEGYVFDIAKRMPIEALVSQVLEHFGHIDILVNHASVKPDEALVDMDEWEFHRTLDVNLGGPFFCMQQVGRHMQTRGGGTIINLAFTSETKQPVKGRTAYLASQAGLVGLTRAAADEFSLHNIRVNAVCCRPGEIDIITLTEWDKAAYQKWSGVLTAEAQGAHRELVSLVLFLCSNAASNVSGQVIITGSRDQSSLS